MVKEFPPYGATWAELKKKSGLKPTAYKRAFNWATERKWLVGGGKRGELYYLNPDGSWRAALGPAYRPVDHAESNLSVGPIESTLPPEIGSSGPNVDPIQTLDPNSEIDSIVALASGAIQHVDQKKQNKG